MKLNVKVFFQKGKFWGGPISAFSCVLPIEQLEWHKFFKAPCDPYHPSSFSSFPWQDNPHAASKWTYVNYCWNTCWYKGNFVIILQHFSELLGNGKLVKTWFRGFYSWVDNFVNFASSMPPSRTLPMDPIRNPWGNVPHFRGTPGVNFLAPIKHLPFRSQGYMKP